MELFLAGCQGLGLAGAAGIRPVLPLLLAALASRAQVGVSFGDTDFAFLQSWLLLAALFALAAGLWWFDVTGRHTKLGEPTARTAAVVFSLAAAAVLSGASLADVGHPAWPGMVAGVLVALLTGSARGTILTGARRRAGNAPRGALVFYLDLAALAVAALAVALPPLSLLVVPVAVGIVISARRRRRQKFAGLRTLR